MALTVEDGTGMSNADSFSSLVDATAFHAARGNAAWAALASDAVREQLLIKATDYLQNAAVFPWRGRTKTATQALAWPRTGVTELYGQPVPSTVVPVKVRNATAILALVAATTNLQPVASLAAAGVKRQKIDTLEIEYFQEGATDTTEDSATQTAQVTEAMGLVRPLIRVTEALPLSTPYANLPPRTEPVQSERPEFYIGQHDNLG